MPRALELKYGGTNMIKSIMNVLQVFLPSLQNALDADGHDAQSTPSNIIPKVQKLVLIQSNWSTKSPSTSRYVPPPLFIFIFVYITTSSSSHCTEGATTFPASALGAVKNG